MGMGCGDLEGQRSHHGRRLNIALNMRGGKQNLNLAGRVPLSTYLDREGERIDGQVRVAARRGSRRRGQLNALKRVPLTAQSGRAARSILGRGRAYSAAPADNA
jgi:hypothetical protein